jgi:hypothetical protein
MQVYQIKPLGPVVFRLKSIENQANKPLQTGPRGQREGNAPDKTARTGGFQTEIDRKPGK